MLGLRFWAPATAAAVFLQLMLGATMRHTDAGLAVPDFPRIYGAWFPPLDAASLAEANRLRFRTLDLDPVNGWQVATHLAHRLWAFVVAGLVLSLFLRVGRRTQDRPLRVVLNWMASLVLIQVALGMWVIWSHKAADVATAHVALGALILMLTVLLSVITFRRLAPVAGRSEARPGEFNAALGQPRPVR